MEKYEWICPFEGCKYVALAYGQASRDMMKEMHLNSHGVKEHEKLTAVVTSIPEQAPRTGRWKKGDPGAEQVMKDNVAFYDKVRSILTRRCKVPDCGYTISSIENSYSVMGVGEVCGVCYWMDFALQSPGLKNIFYFKRLHDQWVADNNDKNRRDRLGL